MGPSRITVQLGTRRHPAAKAAVRAFSVVSAVLVLSVSSTRTEAAVINAANVSVAAVQTAVAVANAGDTVIVPAGTATWTNSLIVTKDIQLLGAGIDQTIITDEMVRVGGRARLIEYNPVPGFPRISGFTFSGGNVNTANGYSGILAIEGGPCYSFRVDHCKFNEVCNNSIVFNGQIYGVVDNCQFWLNYQRTGNGVVVYDAQPGFQSYAAPVVYGDTNFVYVESCTFTETNRVILACDDMFSGARTVFRYNNFTNIFFQTHGADTSGMRSGRAFELYENNFVTSDPAASVGLEIRGGTGVIFSNIFTGNWGNLVALQDLRSGQSYAFGGGNGLNPIDSNNPAGPIATGTHTGVTGANVLHDDNTNWVVGQWAPNGYELVNLTQGGTNYTTSGAWNITAIYGSIYSNTVHEIYTVTGQNPNISWTNGDHYAIYQSYQHIDQVGAGSGDLMAYTAWNDFAPSNTVTHVRWGNPRQAIEPLYLWGNTFRGTSNYSVDQQGYGSIQLNRDYFNAVKPGYTPLVYPHPLVSSSGTGTGTGSGTGTNTVIPPSELQAHPPGPQ